MANEVRTFESKPAEREHVPLLIGIVGPSGGGKTFSALRLARGIQRVSGGDIHVIDTEARRALHYASIFRKPDGSPGFMHTAFGAPFGSLDYLAAIEHCVRQGAKTIVIDSASHEHEGPGGLLEQHAAEVHRIAGDDWRKAERVKMLAWQKPKANRRRLINSLLQLECNFILCFRAKQKLKIIPGKEPEQRGWMPIAAEELAYELAARFLLLPGANGVPTFSPEHEDERAMVKIPEQFRSMLAKPEQLSEDLGERMARWAAGSAAPPAVTVASLLVSYAACSDPATLRACEVSRGALWKAATKEEKAALKGASDGAAKRIEAAAKAPEVSVSVEYEPSDDDSRDPLDAPNDAAHADYVRDAEAWRLHLENEPNPHAVAGSYHKRSGAFDRAGVRDARRESAVTVIAMKSNGDLASADAFLTAYPDRARRKASGAQTGEGT